CDGHALRRARHSLRRRGARCRSPLGAARAHELRQAAPMASGLGHLRFRCTGCGTCCRDLRVPLTDADLRRLIDATGRAASEIVAWLPTDSVDLIGEPGSLVLLG